MSLLEQVKEAGVVGAGGAGFPTYAKLNCKAEYILMNGAECEPLLRVDQQLMAMYPDEIIQGFKAAGELVGAQKAIIGIKGKHHDVIEILEEHIKSLGVDQYVSVGILPDIYPAGDEQVLVHQVTGRVVPERGLPLNVGCVVENVGTVLSIADALEDKPVQEKYLSVTGAVKKPVMCLAPLGTPIREVLAKAELLVKRYAVIMGGPMMGKMLSDEAAIDQAVVTKTTGNLLVLPEDHYLVRRAVRPVSQMMRQAATACLQCRACTDLCPRSLLGHHVEPHMVMRSIWRKDSITDPAEFERALGSAVNCSSCGTCEMFSCPMGLSPRKMNDYAKTLLRERGIQPEKNQNPAASGEIEHRRIPTERLIARLALSAYVYHGDLELYRVDPEEVFVPMSQHIGKPAVPAVSEGDTVKAGDLAGAAAEGLSANIYTGLGGTVTQVTHQGIRIRRREA